MFKKIIILIFLFVVINDTFGQMKVFDSFEELDEQILQKREDSLLYVINFWATWCKPCVKELPYFEQANQNNENIKVILVSLDFKHQVQTKLIPFIEQIGYSTDFVLLNDTDYNAWIDKIDSSWSGAIPATLFLKQDKRLFKEKQYHSARELQEEINQILKQ